jgi:hypothetical protein
MQLRSMTRHDAERKAFRHLMVEYLNATHPNTDPNRCAHCGRFETPDQTLLPIGAGERHAWLHQCCRDRWAEAHRKAAVETLRNIGITEPLSGPVCYSRADQHCAGPRSSERMTDDGFMAVAGVS